MVYRFCLSKYNKYFIESRNIDHWSSKSQVIEMDKYIHPRIQVERTVSTIFVCRLSRKQSGVPSVVQCKHETNRINLHKSSTLKQSNIVCSRAR